jgi:hypothetical protein
VTNEHETNRQRGEALRREAGKQHAEEEAARKPHPSPRNTSDTDNWTNRPPRE